MIAILLAILVAFIWAFGDVQYSKVSKKHDKRNIFFYTYCIRSIIYLGIVIIWKPSILGTFQPKVLQSMLPIIMCDLFASLTINMAVTNGKLSVVSPIMASYPMIDILLGTLLLKEDISMVEVMLVVIISISIILLARNQKSNRKVPHPKKGILFSILYMLLSAFSIYFEKKIYNTNYTVFDLYYYKGSIYVLASLFFAITISMTKTKMKKPSLDFLKGCGLTPLGNVIDSFSLNIGDMTIVTPISSLYAIITNFASRYYLKEKISTKDKLYIYLILVCTFTLILLKI